MTTALYEARAASTTRDWSPYPLLVVWAHRLSPRRFLRTQRWRTELNAMTDVELKDIGLSRGEIGAVADGRYRR